MNRVSKKNEILVVGRGVARVMLRSLSRIRAGLKTWAVKPRQHEIPIVRAHHGSESAVVGAAALCLPPAQLRRFASPRW